MNRLLASSLLSTALLVVANANATLVIDDFTSGNFSADTDNNTYPLSQTGSMLGGSRDVDATAVGSNLTTSVGSNLYTHDQAVGVTGTSTLTWDGFSSVDVSESGLSNSIQVTLDAIDTFDLPPANTIDIILTDSDSSDSVSVALDNTVFIQVASFGSANLDFLFSDYSGIDFTAVTEIQMFIDGTTSAATEYNFSLVQTFCSANTSSGVSAGAGLCVPTSPDDVSTPATLALILAGLFGLRRIRR